MRAIQARSRAAADPKVAFKKKRVAIHRQPRKPQTKNN
jgi:hypothetical protein